jgi:CBS domain-containing protein
MTVGRICQREVDLADAGEPVRAAAQRMRARNVGSLVILDTERRPIGIVTDRDLALAVVAEGRDADEVRVGDVMSPAPRTVSEDTPIEDTLAVMRARHVRRLPVVDARGRLVGMVSVDDVLSLLAEEFAQLGGLIEGSSPHALARE